MHLQHRQYLTRPAAAVAGWWSWRKTTLLRFACATMACAALPWLGYQFWRLLFAKRPIWPGSPVGAFDLAIIRHLVDLWFAGQPIYAQEALALYPPASYVMVWPALGWLPPAQNRWLWGLTLCLVLATLVVMLVRISSARARHERVFVALLPLATYATGATIGNGQLTLHVLAALLAAMTLVYRDDRSWGTDLLASLLLLLALVKPSIAAPFCLLVLLRPHRWRVLLPTTAAYAGLTVWSASCQADDVLGLVQGWLGVGERMGARAGTANVHIWLGAIGLRAWALPASLALLALLALWLWRRRRADAVVLLAVTAIFARLWAYHRWYDDLLLLLPMVALFVIAHCETSDMRRSVAAGLLLAATTAVMLAPGGLFLLPSPWNRYYLACETTIWVADLVFLLVWGPAPLEAESKARTAMLSNEKT